MRETIAIIPAAGEPKNPIFKGIYDLMIPINGKPTIDYIFDSLEKNKISKAIILVNEKDIRSIKYLNFKEYNIPKKVIEIKSSSLFDTMTKIRDEIKSEKLSILVNLGDTIFTGKMDFSSSFLITSKKDLYSTTNWCFVKKTDKELELYDKPPNYKGGEVITGIYFFKDSNILIDLVRKNLEKKDYNYNKLIKEYADKDHFKIIQEKNEWFDIGHLDHYQRSRKAFLRSRAFNSFEYDEFKGVITKKSKNNTKLQDEINWFNNIPKELKIFTPRIVNYVISSKKSEYSLEFYGYPPLSDLYTYGDIHEENWKLILKKILEYVNFTRKSYNKKISLEDFEEIYCNKTIRRMKEIESNNQFFKEIMNKKIFRINGKEIPNPLRKITKDRLKEFTKEIYKDKDMAIIHGDLCFNNILYDITTGIFKLIDPRGSFGKENIYGDVKYDLAKLRHSICGYYDLITADLFTYNDKIYENSYVINYQILGNNKDKKLQEWFDETISKDFNLKYIKTIEGLLFLTMIPIHNNSLSRQKIMFSKAIILLSENI